MTRDFRATLPVFEKFSFPAAFAVVDPQGEVYRAGETTQIFPWASVTKVLASRAIQVAVDRYLVDLTQPGGPPGATLKHLLAHASGLGLERDTVLTAPGTRRIYSDINLELASEIVAEAAATPFDQWVEDTVVAPLGMSTVSLPGSAAHSAQGNVADLALLAQELLQPHLVSSSLDAIATHPVFPGLPGVLPGYGSQKDNSWGLGFEIRNSKQPHWTAPEADPATFGHFGVSGSFIWVDRGRNLAAVFLGAEPFGSAHKELWPELNHQILAAI